MAVDGGRNSVSEVNFSGRPDRREQPPRRHADHRDAADLREGGAAPDRSLPHRAIGVVTNPTMRNVLGEPVGYRLVPGANALPFLDPESPVGRSGRLHVPAFLGFPLPGRRALPWPAAIRTSTRAVTAWPRWTDAGPLPGRPAHRRLVHPELPSSAAPRGLAGAALRLCRLPLDAVGLFRQQSRPGRAAALKVHSINPGDVANTTPPRPSA